MSSRVPATTPEAMEDVLVSLELLAEERLKAITQAKDLRAVEELRHKRHLELIADNQRGANRVLVEAIDAAAERGVRKTAIYARIGLTSQRIGQIRAALDDRKTTEGDG